MSSWNRREVVYVRPDPKPETVADLYSRLLEASPFTPLAHALAYFIGKNTDKSQALACAKRLAIDPETHLRCAGAVALAQLHQEGLRDAERVLWQMLEDPEPAVREAIAEELKFDSAPETAKLLYVLVKDHTPLVRKHATYGLTNFQDTSSRQILIGLVRDEDESVRAEVVSCLAALEGEPIDISEFMFLAEDSSAMVRANLAGWLAWVDKDFALPHLLRLTRDSEAAVRNRAINALGSFEGQPVVDRLVEAASDPSDWVRASALRSLDSNTDPRVIDLILAGAEDPASEVRKVAAQHLEGIATAEMLPILEKLREDEANANTRRCAVRGLESIPGEEAERLLVRSLRDPSVTVSKAAKKALERRAKVESLEPGTSFELRFGQKQAVATRLAFHGRSAQPLKAWEQFLSRVQRLDGVTKADSIASPSIQFESIDGAHFCIMPFGPANWIRIELTPAVKGGPRMAYAILSTEEVGEWSRATSVKRFHHGLALSKRLGWIDGQSATGPHEEDPPIPVRRRGRSPRRENGS